MLRIKPEVDLKTLEKFGFEYGYSWWFKDLRVINREEEWSIAVSTDDKRIQLGYSHTDICGVCTYIERELDVLYDLIEAGLVEKVRE